MFERRIPYGAWVEQVEGEMEGRLDFCLAPEHGLSGEELRLVAKEPPAEGKLVQLLLLVENEPEVVSVDGEVVRREQPAAEDLPRTFVVRFVNLDQQQRQFLDGLVAEAA